MRSFGQALLGVTLAAATAAAGPDEKPGHELRDPARAEQMEKRLRTMRALGIAEALDLDTAETLKVDTQMRAFDDRRRPLQKQVHEAMRTLRKAADGDAQAAVQVDVTTQKLLDVRAQLAQVDREMYAALAQGRTPQQKARLALFLARFHGEAKGLHAMMQGGPGGMGPDHEP